MTRPPLPYRVPTTAEAERIAVYLDDAEARAARRGKRIADVATLIGLVVVSWLIAFALGRLLWTILGADTQAALILALAIIAAIVVAHLFLTRPRYVWVGSCDVCQVETSSTFGPVIMAFSEIHTGCGVAKS